MSGRKWTLAFVAAAATMVLGAPGRAQEFATLLPLAKDWESAAERARAEHKLVLAIVQVYPGIVVPAEAALGHFLEQELLDLVRERFVPLHVTSPDAVPFAAPDRYGMGPHCFGASALVVTADGDVVADTFLVGNSASWLDEFLRGVLAERGEDAFDGSSIADPLERAAAFARRGELIEASGALRGIESVRACLLRARLARRRRDGKGARAELARAEPLLATESAPPELRVEVEIERAVVAAGLGELEESKAAYARALALAPQGPRSGEIRFQQAMLVWCAKEYPEARHLFGELARDQAGEFWGKLAAAQLADGSFELGATIDTRWPSDALLDSLVISPPAPLRAAEAPRAEREAVARLLADQRTDGSWGSWFVGTDLATDRIDRPDALRIAVGAIAAQALLPEQSDPAAARALQRALPWLLAQTRRARAEPPPREAMDYWPWAYAYTLWFLADAVKSGFTSLAELGDEPAKLAADAAARQQENGGWSYLVSVDTTASGAAGAGAEPLPYSMSFTTGAMVAALQAARDAGFALPGETLERALGCLLQARVGGDSFLYAIADQESRVLVSTESAGAAGRDAFLGHLLQREGRGGVDAVAHALARFDDHLDELAREQGKTLMHCGPEGLGSHYVFFDYANTARVLAESAARAPGRLRARLLEKILDARLADGSFVDNPLIGRAYGTAMALQALRFLRTTKQARAEARATGEGGFERVVLDDQVGIGYGVAVADVDGDGKRDILLVDQHEVRWYRAPDWQRYGLCGALTKNDHVCIAARDLDGDGAAEIAVGADWNPGDPSAGALVRLEPGADRRAPWNATALPRVASIHRMKWVRKGDGAFELFPLPLHPDQSHGFDVVEWDGDAEEEILIASREGIALRGGERLTTSAASEVRLGRFADGRRFLASIEPFHGHELVVHVEPARAAEPWTRTVVDASLAEGHALACGDLFGRGDDAIVVGWRKPGADGKTGIRIFTPVRGELPGAAPRFESSTLDESIACEDLALADLDEDGRLDVVASGRDSHDLVLFRNLRPLREPAAASRRSGEPTPRRASLDVARLAAIDDVVADAIARKVMPGCVVAIGRSDGIVFEKAYGDRALVPARAPMAVDTLFDLASLTKPIATATSLELLADDGKLALDDPLSKWLSEMAPLTGAATLRRCLEHTAGFLPDNDLADYDHGVDEAWRRLFAQAGAGEAAAPFVYSDVGYELLGKVVERASGRKLDEFARERIFAPLRMNETGFLPDASRQESAAPTERRDGAMLQGVVHDPRAAKLGGVAGHAGLFSTADDLARYARMLLNGGVLDGVRVLSRDAVARLTTAELAAPGTLRTPGFDARSRLSGNRGETMTSLAFGHGGFTGTGIWIDPGLDLFVVFLSSRLHPDGAKEGVSVNPLIGRIGTIAAVAVGRPRAARHEVKLGIDVLRDGGFAPLGGRRVGLVTNHSGRASDGTPTDALLTSDAARAAGVTLVRIFTPEHGLDGKRDAPIVDGAAATPGGVPIVSLYGAGAGGDWRATRKPTAAMLEGIDTLLFDVQDAGARCYTYVTTMGLCMEAAAERGLRFVVLDRPNPIGGDRVGGPAPDPGRESFTNYGSLPFRHGLTMGELARLFRATKLPQIVGPERAEALDLRVVAMEGWRRADLQDDTTIPWIDPSPNLRSLDATLLYPGLVWFEPCALSVGRGTERPFEQLGAPWLDGSSLAADLASRTLPGVAVSAVEFTPTSSKFAGERCGGVRFEIVDRATLDPIRIALEVAAALQRRSSGDGAKEWGLDAMDALLCSKETIAALRAGAPAEAILARFDAGCAAFAAERRPFLLYE